MSQRHASTSTTPAHQSSYGRGSAPPPPAKGSKTTVPVKSSVKTSTPPITVPARTNASKTTTVPTLKAKELLNPPHFTYAPEITVPARQADQNVAKWLWKAGRAYLTFYKTGISNVRQTSKLAKTLKAKASKVPDKDSSEVLTRAEWQIIRRSKKDVLRLPAFGVLVLLLGEWLPLVVMYITPVIPEACRIPQQVKRDLTKRENSRQERLRRAMLDSMRLMSKDPHPAGHNIDNASSLPKSGSSSPSLKAVPWADVARTGNAKDMTLFELVMYSAQFNCHSRIWDFLRVTPPKWLLQRNVAKTIDYVAKDDALIERDGGWAALGKTEVERACVDRGISVVGKREDELRKALATMWRSKT